MNYSVQITQQIALLRSAAALLDIIDRGEKPWSQSELNALVEAFAAVGSTDKSLDSLLGREQGGANFPAGFIGWLYGFVWAAVTSEIKTSEQCTRYTYERLRARGWIE